MHNMFVDTFLQECEDLLPEIEECALALNGEGDSREIVGRLFRAFHTIKGSGAMVGLDHVAGFTHHVETLLDGIREDKVAISPRVAELVLASADEIKRLMLVEPGSAPLPSQSREDLIAELERLSAASTSTHPGVPQSVSCDESVHLNMQHPGQQHPWQI